MLSFMQDWDLVVMLWLLPVVFFIHDGEEIATIEWWLRKNQDNPWLSKISPVPISWNKHITLQFTYAVLLIGFVLTSLTFLTALNFEIGSPFNVLFAGFAMVILLDGVKHAAVSIFLRKYTPGVLTAVILEIPYGIYALYRFLHADMIVDTASLLLGSIIALPVTLLLVWMGLTLGGRIAPFRHKT